MTTPASDPTRRAVAIAVARIGAGLGVLLILAYTFARGTGGPNPFDFFGYFTNLTNLLTAALLLVTGARAIWANAGRAAVTAPEWLRVARGVSVACLLIVGVVYNVLVPGTGAAPPWVSAVLHVIMPALVLLDWICIGDRGALRWRTLWAVLPYPLVWLVVVLIRGATDGWVPYGFLLPERGSAALVLTCLCLLAALVASAALVWLLSQQPGAIARDARASGVRPRSAPRRRARRTE